METKPLQMIDKDKAVESLPDYELWEIAKDKAVKELLSSGERIAEVNMDRWTMMLVAKIIDCMPSIEAVPMEYHEKCLQIEVQKRIELEKAVHRNHGHWEFCAESVETMWDCKCSVCGSIERPLQRHHYCPNCGAKMDEVSE